MTLTEHIYLELKKNPEEITAVEALEVVRQFVALEDAEVEKQLKKAKFEATIF